MQFASKTMHFDTKGFRFGMIMEKIRNIVEQG